jgi:hypothetical protein
MRRTLLLLAVALLFAALGTGAMAAPVWQTETVDSTGIAAVAPRSGSAAGPQAWTGLPQLF